MALNAVFRAILPWEYLLDYPTETVENGKSSGYKYLMTFHFIAGLCFKESTKSVTI